MTERAAGRSFAEIAEAEGVGTDELQAEATRIETAELDAAVKADTMTAAECTQALSGLQAYLREELTETHALLRDGRHGSGRDGDGPRGSTADQSASGGMQTDRNDGRPGSRRSPWREAASVCGRRLFFVSDLSRHRMPGRNRCAIRQ